MAHGGDGSVQQAFGEDFRQIWDSFNKLRLSSQLCDAVLKVNDREFSVHRAILAANSPFFRALFTNGMKESEQAVVTIPMVEDGIMEHILNYIYTRSVRINMDNVMTLLPQADSFMVQGLVEQCCDFLISALHPTNCIGIMKFAQNYYHQEVAQQAHKYIRREFESIQRRSIEFLQLELEELLNLISDDHLNVRSEERVWEACLRWIEYAISTRAKDIIKILSQIRLGRIRSSYFVDGVANHPLVIAQPDCLPLINNAWTYVMCADKYLHPKEMQENGLLCPRVPEEVLFVIGGWSGGSPVSFLESFDNQAERWYAHPELEDNTPRAYHGMVAVKGLIYVIGGFDGTTYYNSVRCFDPVKKAWGDVAPMYNQRCYVSVAVARGHIYACGGYDGRSRLDSAEGYNPQTNQWTQLPDMNCRRSDASADSVNGKAY